MRGYWILLLLGVVWSLPGATCSIASDYKGKDNPCALKPNPNGPVYNGPVAREQTETQRYVPKDIKRGSDTVIMTNTNRVPELSPIQTREKSETKLADNPTKPTRSRAAR